METITIPKEEYKTLKKKAKMDEDLLISLVRGLEDISLRYNQVVYQAFEQFPTILVPCLALGSSNF